MLLLSQTDGDGDTFLVLRHGHIVEVIKKFGVVLAVGRIARVLGWGEESFIALCLWLRFVLHDPALSW